MFQIGSYSWAKDGDIIDVELLGPSDPVHWELGSCIFGAEMRRQKIPNQYIAFNQFSKKTHWKMSALESRITLCYYFTEIL